MGRGHRSRRHSSSRGREWRDFWEAWKEERMRLWEEQTGETWEPGMPPPSPREMRHHWREFFHARFGSWPEDHWAFGGRRFSPWHQGRDAFNPFVASVLSKGGGLLPLLVLHLLSEQPRYGNEITEKISEYTGGHWDANPGALYPLLSLLEERGLIKGEWQEPEKRTVRYYRLTETGEKELVRVKTIVVPKLQEAIDVINNLKEMLETPPASDDE